MKKIEALRTNLLGHDFLWATHNWHFSVVPGRPISPGKTHIFDETLSVDFGGQGLACLFCAQGIKRVNFDDGEIMIKAQWDAAADQKIIKLNFKPAIGKKILGVGTQYAVNAVGNTKKCPFTAKLTVTDDTGLSHSPYETEGETTTLMDKSAVFLGADADAGEAITSAVFSVAPMPNKPILGFYINSLRIRMG